MQRLYNSRAWWEGRATIKIAHAEAMQVVDPQRESCRATMKSADAKAIQVEGPRREEKGKNKDSGCRGYSDQGPPEGGGVRQ